MKIIFDYNRTLFNPESGKLYPGTIELLKMLYKKYQLFLITKNEPGRDQKITEFGIKEYFQDIAFVDKKTIEIFKKLVNESESVMVVGDRVKDEIKIGNKLGYTTVWIRQGKFAKEYPVFPEECPDYAIFNLNELLKDGLIYDN